MDAIERKRKIVPKKKEKERRKIKKNAKTDKMHDGFHKEKLFCKSTSVTKI